MARDLSWLDPKTIYSPVEALRLFSSAVVLQAEEWLKHEPYTNKSGDTLQANSRINPAMWRWNRFHFEIFCDLCREIEEDEDVEY